MHHLAQGLAHHRCPCGSKCFYSLSSETDSLTEVRLMPNVPHVLDPISPILPPHPLGVPLDPTFLFQCITANIICSIVFGERFDYKDHQFLHLLNLIYQTFSLMSSLSSQVRGWEKRSIQGRGNKRLLCR